jgi:hypothetical protein
MVMRVTAELQDIKHNRVRYEYAATARGKPGKRTRCRAFLAVDRNTVPETAQLLVELSIEGSVKKGGGVVLGQHEDAYYRWLVRDAAENPEQWL